jgi:hypothetical protein
MRPQLNGGTLGGRWRWTRRLSRLRLLATFSGPTSLRRGAPCSFGPDDARPAPLSSFTDLVDAECFVNHAHILDEFEHDAGLDAEPFWNSGHDDFKRAVALAVIVAEAWAVPAAALHRWLLLPLFIFGPLDATSPAMKTLQPRQTNVQAARSVLHQCGRPSPCSMKHSRSTPSGVRRSLCETAISSSLLEHQARFRLLPILCALQPTPERERYLSISSR